MLHQVIDDCYSWIQTSYKSPVTSLTHYDHGIFFHNTCLHSNKWKNIIAVPYTDTAEDYHINHGKFTMTLINSVLATIPQHTQYSILIPHDYNTPNQHIEEFIAHLLSIDSHLVRSDTFAMILETHAVSDELVILPDMIYRVALVNTSSIMKEYVKVNRAAYRGVATQEDLDFFSQIELNDPSVSRFLAYDQNGDPVACAAIFYNKRGSSAFLFDITVLPSMQKKGIGTWMTLYCMKQVENNGYKYCSMTGLNNAKSLYSKLGFKDIGYITYLTKMSS